MRALPWVVLNQRTAITRVLARRIMTPGSNPTSLAKQLLESKSEWFDGLRAQVAPPALTLTLTLTLTLSLTLSLTLTLTLLTPTPPRLPTFLSHRCGRSGAPSK